ncbi:MAG: thioesterase family protein [Acidobacteriota bacterium]
MREQYRTWITLPVRWGDMDAFGHVNNAKYFTYCESARIFYFEQIGISSQRESSQRAPAVVTATCNFRQQVHHPATLDIGVRTAKIGRTSFTLEYGIFLADSNECVADGSSVVVWVDYSAQKSAPLPDAVKQKIQEIDKVDP